MRKLLSLNQILNISNVKKPCEHYTIQSNLVCLLYSLGQDCANYGNMFTPVLLAKRPCGLKLQISWKGYKDI